MRPAPARALVTRLYAALLRLVFPRDFREAHGADAIAVFGAMYEDAYRSRGAAGLFRLCRIAFAGAVRGGGGEWLARANGGQTDGSQGDHGPGRPAGPVNAWRHSMDRLISNVRFALRSMRKNPGFTLTVVLLLGLGVGATTTIFSIVDGVLLKRLPYPDSDRLVFIGRPSHSGPDFAVWQERMRSFDAIAGVWTDQKNLTGSGRPERLRVGQVTEQFFDLFAGRAGLGRLFVGDDFGKGEAAVVLGHGLWLRRFGGAPGVIGSKIVLDGEPVVVAGVMSAGFAPPEALTGRNVDAWLALDPTSEPMHNRNYHVLQVAGRLRPGATLAAAAAEMDGVSEQIATEFPGTNRNRDGTPRLFPLQTLLDATIGRLTTPLLMLLGAVGLLLAIACANVAHLMLVRGADRAREMAVRSALGSGGRGLLGHVLTEGIVISLLGGAVGTAVAIGGVRLFRAFRPDDIPRLETVGVDYRVLGFALAVSVLTGIVFSLLPAIQAMRTNAAAVLKEHGSNATATGGRRRVQSVLVVVEIALSLVLLTGAGLLFASLMRLQGVDAGFDTEQIVTIPLQLRGMAGPPVQGAEAERTAALVHDMLDRVAGVSGVSAVAAGTTAPFDYVGGGHCCWQTGIRATADANEADAVHASVDPVTAGYFSTLGVRLIAGREFVPADARATPAAVIINAEMARRLYGDAQPLDREVLIGDPSRPDGHGIVVGVIDEVHHFGADQPVDPQIYVPYESYGAGFPFLTVIVRTSVPAGAVTPALRQAIWSVAPDVPIDDVTSVSKRMHDSFAQPRFLLTLLGTFAIAALLLAAGGIYGTLLYAVRRRQQELGIRLALGARRADIVRLVVRHGLKLVIAGIVLGVAGSLAGTRLLQSLLFDVSPRDTTTFAAVSLILGAVALLACWIPAAKAGRTDPMRTLRTE